MEIDRKVVRTMSEKKLIRDNLGSPIPHQQWDNDLNDFVVKTLSGNTLTRHDVNWGKTRMLRDQLSSPIPQIWDDTQNKFVPYTPSSGGGDGNPVYWQDIQNKPSTFPASPHTHSISQVDGLQERLENIPVDVGWNDIKDKPSAFPPSSHNHSISQISGLQAELNSLKSRISDLELEVDLLKNGTDDKVLQYLVKERITTNVIDEPRKGTVDVVQYPDDFQVGESFSVELKEE